MEKLMDAFWIASVHIFSSLLVQPQSVVDDKVNKFSEYRDITIGPDRHPINMWTLTMLLTFFSQRQAEVAGSCEAGVLEKTIQR